MYVKLTKNHLVTCKTYLLTHLALFCAIQLGFLYVVKITTGQTLDSKFVPNSLNVRTTARGDEYDVWTLVSATYRLPGWVQ